MLDVLGGRRVLMLQGPAGPFFRRVAQQLHQRGATVTKVNFNAADGLFFRGPEVVPFRGRFEQWPAFFRRLVAGRHIDALVLFGDTRPLHRMAIEQAGELGVDVFVFEEGYLRPDFVTFQKDSVVGGSSIPGDPEFYRQLTPTALPQPRSVGNVLARAAGYAIVYVCTHGLLEWRYPHYRHHRDIRPFRQAYCWARSGVRRAAHRWRDRDVDRRIASGEISPFFFVPLQVHLDAAVRRGPFASVEEFLERVVASFAHHASRDTRLIVKDHPLGRPYRSYTRLVERLGREHRLDGRLLYVDVIHLPTALKKARGTVTINSTVGLSSIHHGAPVKCLGPAVYDMPGLTFQSDLDRFWRDPGEVDGPLYRRFRWWLRTNNQINGSVWRELWP